MPPLVLVSYNRIELDDAPEAAEEVLDSSSRLEHSVRSGHLLAGEDRLWKQQEQAWGSGAWANVEKFQSLLAFYTKLQTDRMPNMKVVLENLPTKFYMITLWKPRIIPSPSDEFCRLHRPA